jgi:uncharacterized protein YecT (DUF1311 family)
MFQAVALSSLVTLAVFSATDARAASFDCASASTTIEKAICDDASLSRLDSRLASLYSAAIANAADPNSIRRQQRTWLRGTRAPCNADRSCLATVYQERIEQLALPADEAACAAVASRGPHYKDYQPLFVSVPDIDDASMAEVERFLGGRRDEYPAPATTRLWHMDLDGDGAEDRFAIDHGDDYIQRGEAFFLSGVGGAARQRLDPHSDTGARDLWLISVGGHYYVISAKELNDDVHLDRLWRIGATGLFLPVCKFATVERPPELVGGLDNPLCVAAAEDRIPFASFDSTQVPVPPRSDDNFYWSKYPKNGIARVDLDNDGTVDNVIRVLFSFARSSGSSCHVEHLAVTSAENSLPKTPLNELLFEGLGGGVACGPSLSVLLDGGVTYIDARGRADRNVFVLHGLEPERVCEFRESFGHTYRMIREP